MKKIKKYFWKTEGMEYGNPESYENYVFHLMYGKFTIGILSFSKGIWSFKYTEEYKANQIVTPITDFPDIEKEYSSNELWPFFAARIPTLNQAYHFKKISNANVSNNNPAQLLKIFGNKSINNPFILTSG
jgi:HipA-like protein